MSKVTLESGKICQGCKVRHSVEVTHDQLARLNEWNKGNIRFIQEAVPEMSTGDREIFISGTCDKVFNEWFPPEED